MIGLGETFAVFDTQDSGNVSYGVRIEGRPYFVKTAGRVDDPAHGQLVERLRNAVELAAITHPTMPALRRVIEAPAGPLLVYDWFGGELLGAPREAERAFDDSADADRVVSARRDGAGIEVTQTLRQILDARALAGATVKLGVAEHLAVLVEQHDTR